MQLEHVRATRRDQAIAAALIVASFLVYNANLRVISTGDSLGTRYVPLAVWWTGSVELTPLDRLARDGHADPYWLTVSGPDRIISTYTLVTPLLVTPLYLPAALYLESVGWHEDAIRGVAKLMEKLAASVVAALSVGLMFGLLRRRIARVPALVLAGAFAFGTSTWMVNSQALWQHGAAQLFFLLGMLAATRSGRLGLAEAALVALCCMLIVANRPPDAPIAFGLALFVLASSSDRRVWLSLLLAGIVAAVSLLVYNLAVYGSVLGGYVRLGVSLDTFKEPFLSGLGGILVSPARGLLAYSPFFVFLLWRLQRGRFAPDGFSRLDACLAIGVVLTIAMYANTNLWRSKSIYGPRMLADILPALIWLLAPVVPHLGRLARVGFGVTLLFAIVVQAIGAFWFPAYLRSSPEEIWDPLYYPPATQLAYAPASPNLPGVTRDLWELEPLEISLAADAEIAGTSISTAIQLSPARWFPVRWPFTIAIEARRPDGSGYAAWSVSLQPIDRETKVQIDVDLLTREAQVQIDGVPPVQSHATVHVAKGTTADGHYVANLLIFRNDSPRFRPQFPLFSFDRVGNTIRVEDAPEPVEIPSVELRVNAAR